jgi:hypothetical protein
VLAAADELEDLAIELKDIVQKLRAFNSDPYKLVYNFRRDVGRVVATLGAGVPSNQ